MPRAPNNQNHTDFYQNKSEVHKCFIISDMHPLSQYVNFSYTSSVYRSCNPCFTGVEKVLLSIIHCQLHKRSTCNYNTWLKTIIVSSKTNTATKKKKNSVYLKTNNTNHNNFLTNLFCYSDHLHCFCSKIPFLSWW